MALFKHQPPCLSAVNLWPNGSLLLLPPPSIYQSRNAPCPLQMCQPLSSAIQIHSNLVSGYTQEEEAGEPEMALDKV